MKFKKKMIFVMIAVFLLIGIFLFVGLFKTGKAVNSETSQKVKSPGTTNVQEVKTSPLSQEEREKVSKAILSTEFVKDIPEKYPISLTFFKFEEGKRIWQDSFLIGKNTLLSSGTPVVRLTLHSKYISEFNGENLCDVIQLANKNRDLGFDSDYSTVELLMKYSGMLKHKSCFGL